MPSDEFIVSLRFVKGTPCSFDLFNHVFSCSLNKSILKIKEENEMM